jgi:hypothetical protein
MSNQNPQRPPKKKHPIRNAFLAGGAAVVALVVTVAVFTPSDPAAKSVETVAPATVKPSVQPTPTPTVTVQTEPEVTEEPVETEAPAEPALSMSQEQAVGTARDYLEHQHFSRTGLIDQLEFEGFTAKDATFGVDYLKVDWNEQAVEVAKDYLAGQHFSRSGLIDQLVFEGFTAKQAAYGVKKAGL